MYINREEINKNYLNLEVGQKIKTQQKLKDCHTNSQYRVVVPKKFTNWFSKPEHKLVHILSFNRNTDVWIS